MPREQPPNPEIGGAARALRDGHVVAFPTETVYGLGADAFNPAAVARVFELKRRPARNPLIVHVLDEAMARRVGADWPPRASRLARAFWPGPLTIVVPRGGAVPPIVTADADTVAVRCPDHPVALALLEAVDTPLVGPSANVSGAVSPTTAQHVRDSFGPDLLILDGGPCRVGIESTVISLAQPRARILRLGAVGPDALAGAIGEPVDVRLRDENAADNVEAPLGAPGMLASHYAPQAPVRLLDSGAFAAALAARGPTAPSIALAISNDAPQSPSGRAHRVIRMPATADAYASRLYAALREADALAPAEILVECPPAPGALWDAIRDRLSRAAAPKRQGV